MGEEEAGRRRVEMLHLGGIQEQQSDRKNLVSGERVAWDLSVCRCWQRVFQWQEESNL